MTPTRQDGDLPAAERLYGDVGSAEGHGVPIMLERWQGRLRLIVWPNIKEQEPQIIDLEGTREDRRR